MKVVALLPVSALFLLASRPAPAQSGPPTEAEAVRLVSVLDLVPGKVVGEIGAGQGQLAISSAKAVAPGGRVYATELGSAKVDALKRNVDRAGAANIQVLEAGVATTGLPSGCCDAIYLRDVYHHLTAAEAILADVRMALRPGGRLLVIDFEPRASLSRVEGVREDRRGHGIPMKVLVEELKAAGFEVKSQDPAWRSGLFAVLAVP